MSDYSKTDIGSGYNTQTAVNTELGKIETAVNSKVDKSGSTMTGDLDMNSNDILNTKNMDVQNLSISGTNVTASGAAVSTLPDQSGNSAKVLSTNGSTAEWVQGAAKYFSTVAAAQADTQLKIGEVIQIGERANALFDVITATTNNGYDIIDGTGSSVSLQLKLENPNLIDIAALGARSTSGLGGGTPDVSGHINRAMELTKGVVLLSGNTYKISSTINVRTGRTLRGMGEYWTELYLDGTATIDFGEDNISQIDEHMRIEYLNVRTTGTFTGSRVFRLFRTFQTYFTNVQYQGGIPPTRCICDLDNLITTESPVRVVFRNCYWDGDQYNVVNNGLPTPVGIWNRAGIQVIWDNSVMQNINIGMELGVDPADPEYGDGSGGTQVTEAEDTFFTNNSRFQIGSLGNIDGATACAFKLWEGGNLVIDNSTIYLNNYGGVQPPPTDQEDVRVIRVFNQSAGAVGYFREVKVTNSLINGNARTDYFYEIQSGGTLYHLFHENNSYVQTKINDSVLSNAGSIEVTEGINHYTNPNTYSGFKVLGNFTSGTPIDISQSRGLVINNTDGGSRVINQFSGLQVGESAYVTINLSGGSTARIRFSGSSPSPGFIHGRTINFDHELQDGEMFMVTKQLDVGGSHYYHITLMNGDSWLQGTATYDPPSLATGASATSGNITVAGAELGDFVLVSAPYDLQGIQATGYVSAANTCKIQLFNNTGGTIDLASGSWRVRALKG